MVAEPTYSQSIPIAPARFNWVEQAKGIGIIFVVVGHALGGIIDSGVAGSNVILRLLFLFIYTFHMPLFFFLSGLFIKKRLKKGVWQFIQKCIISIAFPYFLWSVLQYSIIYFAGSNVNSPASEPIFYVAITTIWSPISQFWFLYILFWFNIFIILFNKIENWFFPLIIAIVMKIYIQFYPIQEVFSLFFEYFIYYVSGILLAAEGTEFLLSRILRYFSAPIIYFGLFVFTIINFLFVVITLNKINIYDIKPIKLAVESQSSIFLIGCLSMILIVLLISNSNFISKIKIFSILGSQSLPIYLLHVIFVAGTRIFLLKVLKINDLPILVVVCTFAGIIGPLIFAAFLKRLYLQKIFGLK